MKGMELPVNALVIIVIAILVLLGVVSLWMSSWGGGAEGITVEVAKTAGCGALARNASGCAAAMPSGINFTGTYSGVPIFDVDDDGAANDADDTLQLLCDRYYGAGGNSANCRKICGCG